MAKHESNFQQFGTDGMPKPNSDHDGGYGIYQLTPPSADIQYWNWKSNVDRAIQKLTEDKNRIGNGTQNRGSDKFWQDQWINLINGIFNTREIKRIHQIILHTEILYLVLSQQAIKSHSMMPFYFKCLMVVPVAISLYGII